MADHVSAEKRVRVTEKRTEINRMRKTRLRTVIKRVRKLIALKDATGAGAYLPSVFSMVDRSAKWGIIKKNTAARYKSRVTAHIKKLAA